MAGKKGKLKSESKKVSHPVEQAMGQADTLIFLLNFPPNNLLTFPLRRFTLWQRRFALRLSRFALSLSQLEQWVSQFTLRQSQFALWLSEFTLRSGQFTL